MKKIAILGSTGSIGTQTLDIIEQNPDMFSASVLSCGANIELLGEQIERHKPSLAIVSNEDDAVEMGRKYPHTEFLYGMEGMVVAAAKTDCDIVFNSLSGMMGLMPTYFAIQSGKDIALANKETLVVGGELIMNAVSEKNVQLLPVDSEHSAIFQALQGNERQSINRIILTASGGPFRGYSIQQLEKVTLAQALNHPNWKMGSKITIDSATMMNKGLEVIEAKWLFGVPAEKIEVVVHPQSIIHSMVEYMDHSIIAQLGVPDMRIPISYALTYPKRIENKINGIDFLQMGTLTFEKPDLKTFQCLDYAYEAIKAGGSYPVVLNAANEVLVQQFLENKISFLDIQNRIEKTLQNHNPVYQMGLEEILEIDHNIRGGFTIMMIVYAILIFCLLIFVHELGHFITAKSVGIRVNEFALGMGPLLFHFTKGETEYSLRALPIGGYCKMEGEDEESSDASAFNNKSFPAKALVVVAGSVMNLLLAIIILSLVFLAVGMPSSTIKELSPDLPAVKAGMLPGDKIVQIEDKTIKEWNDITDTIGASKEDTLTVIAERDSERLIFEVGVTTSEDGHRIIGITPEYTKNPGKALMLGTQSTFEMGVKMVEVIGQLITGEVSTKSLTGPVGIVYMVGDSAKLGILYLAQLTALISLNLAIVNMLPFPALDGGRLMFMIIRLFTGKAVSDETEGKIHFVGLLLLFGLMIYITYQDIGRFLL